MTANNYYVATDGDNLNAGTLEAPFKTIQHAVSIVEPGSTVYIKGGIYREELIIEDVYGTEDNQITFKNFNDEDVLITGAKEINTPWTVHSGNIWKTTVDFDVSQLFLDDKMLTGARWPNITKDWDQPDDTNGYNPTPDSFWDLSTRAEINLENHIAGGLNFEDLGEVHSLADLDFSVEGAMYIPHFADQRGEILRHNAGESTFEIAPHTGKNEPFAVVDGYARSELYYLTAHLKFLDSPREWFYDKDTGELYVWLEDNKDPNNSYIQARAHEIGADNGPFNDDGTNYSPNNILEMTNTSYINFEGITFHTGRFDLFNTDNTNIENCKFLYSTYNGHMLKSDLFTGIEGNKAQTKTPGDNNLVFKSNEFAYTYGLDLVTFNNQGTLIENNIFHNSTIFIKGGNGGPVVSGNTNLTATRNTVHSMGYGGLGRPGKDNIIELNDVYNFYFNADTGGITVNQSSQDGLIIRYNWIHGAPFRNGLRFDGDPAGIGGTANHNVIFEARRGFRLKGDQHTIISNTSFNTDKYDINISFDKFYGYDPVDSRELEDRVAGRRGSEPYQGNFYSIAHNNAADVILDIPILNDDDKTNNSSLLDRGTGIEVELRDPSNFDFRPKENSALVDTGKHVDGFTDNYVGNAPDIGAYEFGDENYWIPGHQTDKARVPIPLDGSETVKSNADLIWLEGIDAISNNIYLGTDPDNLVFQGNQANNIFTPEILLADQEYFWRVDTITDNGIVEGDVWDFTAGPEIQEVNIDYVYVGDPGNESDSNGIGGVSYNYLIGKYEVTNAQYTVFLNSAAASDALGYYNENMGITRSGSEGEYTYSTIDGREDHPVTSVSFWDATSFANWLTSGSPGSGVYNLDNTSKNANTVVRDSTAWVNGGIAIANEDEWYKAAYYSGSSTGADGEGYWLYPTQSNGISTDDANYGNKNGDFKPVGSYTGETSYYGTYDQGGNASEWIDETDNEIYRIMRGGQYSQKNKVLSKSNPYSGTPRKNTAGFRITTLAPNFAPSWKATEWGVEAPVSGEEYYFSISDRAYDPEGAKLTFTIKEGPEWLTLDSDGTLRGTPSVKDIGANLVSFRVTDPKGLYDDTQNPIRILVTSSDLTNPTLSNSSPADNATSVDVDSNILLNFSEAVDVEIGNIIIKKTADDSTIETIDVTTSQITGSGTSSITINPNTTLTASTDYYVQIAATAFDDASGNSFTGIADTTSLSFTTGSTSGPSFVSAAVSADGTKVILTYDATLNATTAPTSAFSVISGVQGNDVNPVIAVNISGSTIELTITNNIKNDDVVKVGYNDPSSGNDTNAIQDASGNDSNSFSAASVTNNSTMPGNAPVLESANTSTDGTKVILTFSEALSSTTAPTSAFTVTSGGTNNSVTAVNISGPSVELTLTTAVKNDQVISVTYADPSGSNDSNAIQDTEGNDVVSLNSTSVANASTVAGTAASFVSAATNSDGSKVILTYNEALSSTTAAANSFVVTSNGQTQLINTVSIAGSEVQLTLASEVNAGDTITVAYADPSGSNDTKAVQDSEGNDATTLGSTSVTNNTKIGLYGALVQIRGEEYRDAGYKNTSNNNVYIVRDNDQTNSPILIQEDNGGEAEAAYLWDSWDGGYRKLHAVERTDSAYKLLIKESHNTSQGDNNSGSTKINWSTIETNASGLIDWSTSAWSEDVSGFEVDFNEDFNDDGAIGVDTSNLTLKTSDTDGAKLATNSSDSLFINTSGSNYIQIVEEWSGSGIILDREETWPDGSHKQEALYIAFNDGGNGSSGSNANDDKYSLAVKETSSSSWGGQKHNEEQWIIYDVNLDGSFTWNANWGVAIQDYEVLFDQDIDGDGSKGVDLSALEIITTDTASTDIKLKRGSGSLYIVDGSSTYKIVDEGGQNPRLEDSGSWEGGSFNSVGYAVEKNADNSTYSLAIKSTETVKAGVLTGSTNSSDKSAMTAWDIHQLTINGSNVELNWDDAAFTTSIAGYENVFQQDMDMDGNVGVNLSTLTNVTTDTTSHRIKYDSTGGIYIWDGSNSSTLTSITDPSGGVPQFRVSHTWDKGSFSVEPYAVYKDNNDTAGNANDDWYRLAVKETSTNTIGETTSTDINWALYKIGLTGEIDYSATLFKKSITSYEDEFGHDMNGDGNFSGNVTLYDRSTDTTGPTLASDTNTAGGSLYIKDGGTTLVINDSWIEESHNWGEGSNESVAIAVRKNDNDTSGNTSDDYYQVAVKQTNKWTDFKTSQLTTDQSWQIYAIYASGGTAGDVNWDKTIWTQAIQGFETDFGQDLDGDGSAGVNISNLKTATGDITGWLLKKDTKGSLYITDNNGNNLKSIKDNYGGAPKFDHTSNWGSGSHKTESVAAEINSDNSTFSIAIKHENMFDGQKSTDWEILNVSNTGVFDWSNSFWTQDIKTYESIFQQDLDGDSSIGINSSSLKAISSDSHGDLLKKGNDGSFYIVNEAGKTISITYEWGGKAQFDSTSQWEGGSFASQAIAVEDETYTSSAGDSTNGYVIAIKNTSTYGSDPQRTDWELKYIDSNGVIDEGKNAYLQSIKSNESLFGGNASQADLDGDGAFGLNAAALTTISTDTNGDRLKKGDGNSLYIVEGSDVFPILDEWGGTPTFDWSDSGGTGSNAWSYTSAAYAVESFTDASDSNKKKFLLAVKGTDVKGGTTSIFWETYKIKETSVGSGKWFIDWGSSSWSQSIGNKESVFGQDLDGDDAIFNINNITTTAISYDTSTTGNTAATLTKDSKGALYITKGDTNTAIVDAGGAPVAFDWKDTWAGYTYTSESYALEGIDANNNNSIDKYKIAIKQTELNTSDNNTSVQWETYEIATTGVIDWTKGTYGDIKIHEKDLNQDLDGDGNIWSQNSLTFIDISTDTKGALAYKDSSNNLYIAAGKGQTKNAVKDFTGGLISFDEDFSEGNYIFNKSVLAVESTEIGGTDYYKILIKNIDNVDSVSKTSYETVNVLASTMVVDWGTFSYYDDPKKLEQAFILDIDGDGTVTTISSSSTTAVSTDTTGAKLRQTTDGSLFIKDGSSTIQITSPDGGYVDLNFKDTWGTDSFESEAIAVQKVGNDYKLVVEETSSFGSDIDTVYQVYTLTSAGLLDWGKVQYRTKAELNEQEFAQDIDGDGIIGSGSASAASDTFASSVTTDNTDAEVLQKFSNTAQSNIYSIDNSDSNSSDSKIEMFVKGVDGSGKSEYQMDVMIVQDTSDALLRKVGKDTGIGSDDIKALTGLMDFNVTIPDAKNHGKIVSLSWVLPDDTVDPKYLKKDAATGEYFDFKFDSKTGEGAKWDNETKT